MTGILSPGRYGHSHFSDDRQQWYMRKRPLSIVFSSLALLLVIFYYSSGINAVRTTSITASTLWNLPRYWSRLSTSRLNGSRKFSVPEGMKVVGLVFFGRPASVSVLECYLRRNLVMHGGMLDEVIFIARTKDQEALDWLDAVVATSESYTRHDIDYDGGNDFAKAYDLCEENTVYIKIDDDIVFIEDTAIPTIVKTKLEHPEYFVVSANVVNQPALSWVHQHLGVVLPYLPETDRPPGENTTQVSWRASELPQWSGVIPEDGSFPLNFEPPYRGHRWLPLPAGSPTDMTPINDAQYGAFSNGLGHWTISAQEHYSFFAHLENNELWRYKFNVWDFQYDRMGIQFMAILGSDVINSRPIHGDDEYYFTEAMPRATRRHAVIDGTAIVSHYSFGPQKNGMDTTDVLARYQAFASEKICR